MTSKYAGKFAGQNLGLLATSILSGYKVTEALVRGCGFAGAEG
jgi:hypothetical protein